jgi:hypothetical protein
MTNPFLKPIDDAQLTDLMPSIVEAVGLVASTHTIAMCKVLPADAGQDDAKIAFELGFDMNHPIKSERDDYFRHVKEIKAIGFLIERMPNSNAYAYVVVNSLSNALIGNQAVNFMLIQKVCSHLIAKFKPVGANPDTLQEDSFNAASKVWRGAGGDADVIERVRDARARHLASPVAPARPAHLASGQATSEQQAELFSKAKPPEGSKPS